MSDAEVFRAFNSDGAFRTKLPSGDPANQRGAGPVRCAEGHSRKFEVVFQGGLDAPIVIDGCGRVLSGQRPRATLIRCLDCGALIVAAVQLYGAASKARAPDPPPYMAGDTRHWGG